MRVKVRLFSFYKDLFSGKQELEIELQEKDNPTIEDLIQHLTTKTPQLRKYYGTPLFNILKNGSPAQSSETLKDGDEIALMPLPSGG